MNISFWKIFYSLKKQKIAAAQPSTRAPQWKEPVHGLACVPPVAVASAQRRRARRCRRPRPLSAQKPSSALGFASQPSIPIERPRAPIGGTKRAAPVGGRKPSSFPHRSHRSPRSLRSRRRGCF